MFCRNYWQITSHTNFDGSFGMKIYDLYGLVRLIRQLPGTILSMQSSCSPLMLHVTLELLLPLMSKYFVDVAAYVPPVLMVNVLFSFRQSIKIFCIIIEIKN